MDRDDEKKRKRDPWDPFDLSPDIRYLEEIMARMMRQAFTGFEDSRVNRKDFLGKTINRRPSIRVFWMNRGANREPVVERLGGRRPRTSDGDQVREPLVDVVEEDDDLLVVAHLPGAKKQDINLRLRKRRVIISADTPSGKYHKKVELPTEVEKKDYPATYKNGVLRVRLKKAKRFSFR